ncbi:DUF4349 domain-containing protein [Heliobacterium undosum]|uniref:DUF4349 domain-containing protein n=1 Tax=Heliomicrobium undosum TaxID=121734 RepID=A0A845L668_9FIRM|nr:DUF4349 domain-containing protein [Heliomicrobium undosum]MZP31196.1 DUF4349 domain-containing protein [Heliomicrobium undosum]
MRLPPLFRCLSLSLCLILLLTLSGCGASSRSDSSNPEKNQAGGSPSSAPHNGVAEQAAADKASPEGGKAPIPPAGVNDRKMTYTVDMDLRVENMETAQAQVQEIFRSLGGYILEGNMHTTGNNPTAIVKGRVPAPRLDEALQDITQAGKVLSQTMNTKDVTDQLVDWQARLNALKEKERRLLRLVDTAGELKTILELEREIASTRGEIESLNGRLQGLEKSVEMSTITVKLQERPVNPGVQTSIWSGFGVEMGGALSTSLNAFSYLLKTALLAAIFFLPFGLLGWGGYWLYKRWKDRRKDSPE